MNVGVQTLAPDSVLFDGLLHLHGLLKLFAGVLQVVEIVRPRFPALWWYHFAHPNIKEGLARRDAQAENPHAPRDWNEETGARISLPPNQRLQGS